MCVEHCHVSKKSYVRIKIFLRIFYMFTRKDIFTVTIDISKVCIMKLFFETGDFLRNSIRIKYCHGETHKIFVRIKHYAYQNSQQASRYSSVGRAGDCNVIVIPRSLVRIQLARYA